MTAALDTDTDDDTMPDLLPDFPAPAGRQWVAEVITEALEAIAAKLTPPPVKPVLIDLAAVVAMTSLSRATIYRMLSADQFPHPADTMTGATRWKVKDIEKWCERLKAKAA